jgi:hypothetical protein
VKPPLAGLIRPFHCLFHLLVKRVLKLFFQVFPKLLATLLFLSLDKPLDSAIAFTVEGSDRVAVGVVSFDASTAAAQNETAANIATHDWAHSGHCLSPFAAFHSSRTVLSEACSAALTFMHRFHALGSIRSLTAPSTQSRRSLGSMASNSQHSLP